MKWVVSGILIFMLPLAVFSSMQAPQTLRIEMREFAFLPATVVVTAGRPTRLLLVNRGQIAHQFEADYLRTLPVTIVTVTAHVESPGLDVVRLEPEGTATLEFLPRQKGRFTFACTIEGHREAGMRGVLEVR